MKRTDKAHGQFAPQTRFTSYFQKGKIFPFGTEDLPEQEDKRSIKSKAVSLRRN